MVRALDAPTAIGPHTVDALIAQLREAKQTNSRVLLRVTGTDTVQGVDSTKLNELAQAAREANLAVLVAPPEAGSAGQGGAALLYAVAAKGFATANATLSPLVDP